MEAPPGSLISPESGTYSKGIALPGLLGMKGGKDRGGEPLIAQLGSLILLPVVAFKKLQRSLFPE